MNKVFSKSKWIWLKECKANQYADFIVKFIVTEKDAKLRISADSDYEAYLNGHFVYAGQYPDYPNYKIYDEFDVGAVCKEGENTLAVRCRYVGEDTSTYRLEQAGLLFEIESLGRIVAYSGEHILSREDLCYRSGPMEKISPQLGFSFSYDSTKEDDWREGFSKSVAVEKSCELFPRPNKRLVFEECRGAALVSQGDFVLKRTMPTAAETAANVYLRHISLDEMGNTFAPRCPLPSGNGYCLKGAGDGVYALADMGEETAGFVCLDFEVPCDCDVIVAFGEHLGDLRVRSYIDGRNFAFTYRAYRGRNVWRGNLRRLGLRYLQLYFLCERATLYDCRVLACRYPAKRKNTDIRDGLYRKIYENGVRTLENCMHEHYEDCPWREQALYAMDSRNQMLFGYVVFDDPLYAQSNLRLMSKGLREDGLLELCFPARVGVTIPSFSLYFVFAVVENYEFTEDKAFLEEMMPTVHAILGAFERRREERGLVPVFAETPYWNFYEWKDDLDGGAIFRGEPLAPRYDSCLNLLYLYALQKTASLCANVAYGKEISALKDAIVREFFDAGRGAFATVSENGQKRGFAQLPQALAVMTDCVPEQMRPFGELLGDATLTPLSLSNKIWAYEALLKADTENLGFVLRDIEKTFGGMVTCGDTTLYETEGGAAEFHLAGSLCHGWSAVPCYIFQRYAKGKI